MDDIKVVIFEIDGENFAVDIMQVERIIEYEKPTTIPDAPSYIKGVIKYQENILPVMDVKNRFKLKETEIKDSPKIVIIKNNNSIVGLIVDNVKEVADIKSGQIETPPEIVRGISNTYLRGIIKLDNRIIILIDSDKILSKEELNDIKNVVK